MSRIVLLADANSLWTKEYVENVLKEDFDVVIISEDNHAFCDFYQKTNIPVYVVGRCPGSKHVVRRAMFSRKITLLAEKLESIDFFHVHFVNPDLVAMTKKLWEISKNRILTFWGSDLYRAQNKMYIRMNPFFKDADRICFMTRGMKETFDKQCGFRFLSKERVIDFGNPLYQTIDVISREMSRKNAKQYWNIDSEQYVVAVGYNGRKAQQHISVIKQLAKLKDTIKQKLTVVLHFGYGVDSRAYEKEIKKELSDAEIDYVFIDRFLDKRETAILRIATDIMINAQVTDALSGSVVEYLYAGSLLISAKWLIYEELRQRNVEYLTFHSFEELPQKIEEVCALDCLNKVQFSNNRLKLWEMNSWEKISSEWKKLYKI